MSIKVGINGFGRIGRLVLRCAARLPNIEVVGMSVTPMLLMSPSPHLPFFSDQYTKSSRGLYVLSIQI
jgi:lactate dehydrogenase-like 2-hydroxyacid dehydrogenase